MPWDTPELKPKTAKPDRPLPKFGWAEHKHPEPQGVPDIQEQVRQEMAKLPPGDICHTRDNEYWAKGITELLTEQDLQSATEKLNEVIGRRGVEALIAFLNARDDARILLHRRADGHEVDQAVGNFAEAWLWCRHCGARIPPTSATAHTCEVRSK